MFTAVRCASSFYLNASVDALMNSDAEKGGGLGVGERSEG